MELSLGNLGILIEEIDGSPSGFCTKLKVTNASLTNNGDGSFSLVCGGVSDHGVLTGLSDDDHSQYHTVSRANTWIGTKSITDLGTIDHDLLDGLSDDDHSQYLLLAGRVGGQSITGDLTLQNTALHILDTNASHDLIIAPGSDLSADRTFTIMTGDADRTITLNGDVTLNDWFDQAVKSSSNPSFGGLSITTASLNIATTNQNGIVFGSIGTATIGIDISSSGLSGSGDYWIYNSSDDYWRADGLLSTIDIKVKNIDSSSFGTTQNLILSSGANANIIIGPTTTGGMLIGNYTIVGSLADCNTTASSAVITKVGHGLSVTNKMLLHVTDSSTDADKGFFRISSSTVDTITVDRNFSGTNSDVDLTIYQDVLGILPPMTTSGPRIIYFGTTISKPLVLGGSGLATPSNISSDSDIYIDGKCEIALNLYAKGDVYIDSNDNLIFGNSMSLINLSSQFLVGLHNTNKSLVLTTYSNNGKNYYLAAQSYPTIFYTAGNDPDVTDNKWGAIQHNGDGLVIFTDDETGAGSSPATIDNYIGFHTSNDGIIKQKFYNQSVNDEGTIPLPSFTNGCWGWCMAGNNEEYAFFTIDDDGDVILISNSGNVVANADTDTNLCIGTSAAEEPLIIKNRLGGAKNILMVIWYN